jgi:predicted dehydrogenase
MLKGKIRVAIIGVGGIASTAHIPSFLSNSHSRLVALVDVDTKKASKVAKKFNVKKTFQSVDELFQEEEVDAVSICTPPDTHADIALKSFENGAHVLCEKPLATNIESGKRMVEAARTTQKILMVGFHRRFIPNYETAKRSILNGSTGHVYCVEDHFLEPNPLFGWGKSQWFLKPGVGGVLQDLAPHVLDMFNYLFDDFPIAVSAYGTAYLHSPVEEICVFLVEYPKKRLGVGTVSWLSPTVTEYVNIYGTGQNLHVSPKFLLKISPNNIQEISLLRAAGESLISMKFPNMSLLTTKRANPYQREIDNFIERVRKKEISDSNALSALSVIAACDATKRALEKNCKIDIPPPEQL